MTLHIKASATIHEQANILRGKGYNVSQLVREYIKVKAIENGWNDTATPAPLAIPTSTRVRRSL